MNKLLIAALCTFLMIGCTDEAPKPSGTNNDGNGKNYTPSFTYTIGGTTYTSSTITVNFGGKTQMNVLDAQGNLIADMSLPVAKGETISGKTFQIDYSEFEGNANFYVNNDPYAMDGGTLNVTKNEDDRVSGNFSGTAYKMDYSVTPAAKGEALSVTGGVFVDCGN